VKSGMCGSCDGRRSSLRRNQVATQTNRAPLRPLRAPPRVHTGISQTAFGSVTITIAGGSATCGR